MQKFLGSTRILGAILGVQYLCTRGCLVVYMLRATDLPFEYDERHTCLYRKRFTHLMWATGLRRQFFVSSYRLVIPV